MSLCRTRGTDVVACVVFAFAWGVVVEGFADEVSCLLHEVDAFVGVAVDVDFFECAVGVERYGGMVHEVGVGYGVHAAVGEQALYVALEFVAGEEGVFEFCHECFFLFCECAWVVALDGGEEGVEHVVFGAVDEACASVEDDAFK